MAPRPLPQRWSSSSPPTTAHNNGSNGTTPPDSAGPPLSRSVAHYNGTLQWHPAMALHPLPQSWPSPSPATIAHYNGTLQWHHDHSTKIDRHPPPPNHSTLQWHPAMAPQPFPKLVVTLRPPTIAHYNGTLQWHHDHTMAPCNGTTTTPPKLIVTLRLPTIAHYKGTLQWHPGATSNPPKWFVGLPPIGSKNPYSYRYLGNKTKAYTDILHEHTCMGSYSLSDQPN